MEVELTADDPSAVGADLVAGDTLAGDADALRTAAAQAVRACRHGGTVAWALATSGEEQVTALVEGALIGNYDPRRWRGTEPPHSIERLVICGARPELAPVAERAALVGRWVNEARELVDGPPNIISPTALAERAAAVPGVKCETFDAAEAGLGALAAVGGASPIR